jgi:hypothetical protein
VNSSRALKWIALLLLLLPITLGWKLAVRHAGPGDLTDKEVQRQVAEFLIRQHFKVEVPDQVLLGRPALSATAGMCRILIAKSSAIGSDRDLIRGLATRADRVFIVFRGKVYAEQPTWLTVFDFLWSRLRRELGFKAPASPVLAIIASTNCDAEKLPWHELG